MSLFSRARACPPLIPRLVKMINRGIDPFAFGAENQTFSFTIRKKDTARKKGDMDDPLKEPWPRASTGHWLVPFRFEFAFGRKLQNFYFLSCFRAFVIKIFIVEQTVIQQPGNLVTYGPSCLRRQESGSECAQTAGCPPSRAWRIKQPDPSGHQTSRNFYNLLEIILFFTFRPCRTDMECWNTGILEYWLQPHDFCIWIKTFRINCYDFSMDIFIGSSNYTPIMASMAFPYKWVCLFDLKKLLKAQNAMSGDAPNMSTKWPLTTDSIERIPHYRLTRF